MIGKAIEPGIRVKRVQDAANTERLTPDTSIRFLRNPLSGAPPTPGSQNPDALLLSPVGHENETAYTGVNFSLPGVPPSNVLIISEARMSFLEP